MIKVDGKINRIYRTKSKSTVLLIHKTILFYIKQFQNWLLLADGFRPGRKIKKQYQLLKEEIMKVLRVLQQFSLPSCFVVVQFTIPSHNFSFTPLSSTNCHFTIREAYYITENLKINDGQMSSIKTNHEKDIYRDRKREESIALTNKKKKKKTTQSTSIEGIKKYYHQILLFPFP